MSFSGTEIQFLQRLSTGARSEVTLSAAAEYFAKKFELGSIVGRKIYYTPANFAAARSMLQTNHLPIKALDSTAGRIEASAYGGMSEKLLSVNPHADSLAIRAMGGCELDGLPLTTPLGTYLVLTQAQFERVQCDKLMLIENLATFRQLERYRWLDTQASRVLVLYRGDRLFSTGNAKKAWETHPSPLWVFSDFDPAGLAIANALPEDRLERLVLPCQRWLSHEANTLEGRNLYDKQYKRVWQALEAAKHPEIRAAWSLLKALKGAVTQERMAFYEESCSMDLK